MEDIDMLGISALGRAGRLRGAQSREERDTSRLFVGLALAMFVVLVLAGAAAMIAFPTGSGPDDMIAAGRIVG